MRTTYKEIINYNLKLIKNRKLELYEYFLWFYYFKYGLTPENGVNMWNFGYEIARDPYINFYYGKIEQCLPKNCG
jgi:hypothetical protein